MTDETINSLCTAGKSCPGCQLKNLTYSEQLLLKRREAQKELGGLCKISDIIASPWVFEYRNKADALFFEDKNKNIRWGIYRSSDGNCTAAQNCAIHPKEADAIFNDLALLLKSFKIKIYNAKSKTGFFRYAMVRKAFSSEQIMLVLVTREGELPKERSFINALVKKHPEITTVVQNIYCGDTAIMLGTKEKILFGNGYIEEELCSKKFRISPRSFFQINTLQAQNLYSKAKEFASLNENSVFLDAYCGTGTIGIVASQSGARGFGVEINSAAVEDAKINAEVNGEKNIEFICGDAGDFAENYAKNGGHFDAVFVDPPRRGCSEKFLQSLVLTQPSKIVYVSCNVKTLARDARFLKKNGYKIKKALLFDMFPHTNHVETVALLVRNISTKDYVTVEVRPEELELGSLKTHGTYEEIKSYVLNKYGLKVSTLNISQVKRKCGLDVGEAYNKPKKQDSKVPNCPPEKEMAIMDALKHFGMIKA